jgi:DNA-binding MarR family transcriptional regulator
VTVPPLDPTEAAAWRAFVVFWRQGFPQLEHTFRRVGLNHLEYGVLAVLSEQPDGAMPAGELASLAGVSSSRLSHRLKQLELRNDVERRPDPHDARSVIVVVTPQGRKKVKAAYEQHLADVRRLVFDHLTDEQTAALADAMVAVAKNLTDHPFLSAAGPDAGP